MIPISALNLYTQDIWQLWTHGEEAKKLVYAQQFAAYSIPTVFLRGITTAYKCFLNG